MNKDEIDDLYEKYALKFGYDPSVIESYNQPTIDDLKMQLNQVSSLIFTKGCRNRYREANDVSSVLLVQVNHNKARRYLYRLALGIWGI